MFTGDSALGAVGSDDAALGRGTRKRRATRAESGEA
jgi:hypothetical protein